MIITPPQLIRCKSDIYKPSQKPVQTILTNSLQIADILDFILRDIGPSEIWQSTFSISEEFLRRMAIIRNEGLISRANVILDHKACRKIVKLWPFIGNVFESAFMADNHSKILLLKSSSGFKVAVISSQNLTRGNRYESTVIISDESIFDSLLEDFNKISTFHSIPLNDLLGRRT